MQLVLILKVYGEKYLLEEESMVYERADLLQPRVDRSLVRQVSLLMEPWSISAELLYSGDQVRD